MCFFMCLKQFQGPNICSPTPTRDKNLNIDIEYNCFLFSWVF